MRITLRPITRDNFEAVADLRVHAQQRNFLASNCYSIAEASFNPCLITRAVYADAQPVGFMMYVCPEPTAEQGEYAIWRFMIAAEQQGKGYGRQALHCLLAEILGHAGVVRILISYWPDNTAAQRFYASFGFRELGIDADGEMVAVLDCAPNERLSAPYAM
jgi:diamine N-acetyltransferase